ncbi:lamin tail domain-containing protein [Peribacillus acanthi]|uniref:lamin tail domain-containing protein n=1 Tax=Peribacillus acanthi TaxID=2171554 RepID=UPI000D3E8A22|nr:lamin tail domain-containing protein [Peribacillus acanthi]
MKAILTFCLTVLFVLGNNLTGFAVSSTKVLNPKTNIDRHHDFTIDFNVELDAGTVNEESVYVLLNGDRIDEVKITLSSDKKTVKVEAPPKGYLSKEKYTLYLRQTIKALNGRNMRETVEMDFTTKEDVVKTGKVKIESLELNRETVWIHNNDSEDILMDGWRIVSEDGKEIYYFPSDFVLKKGEKVIITSGKEGFESKPTHLLWSQSYQWNNYGDRAQLYDANDMLIDQASTTNLNEQKTIEQKKNQELLASQYNKTLITNNDLLALKKLSVESADTIKWYGYELKDINLYFTKDALKNHIYLYEYGDAINKQIKDYMGSELKYKLDVFVYDGKPIYNTGNQYRKNRDYEYVFVNPTGMDGSKTWDMRPVFAHEMIHAFQGHRWNYERIYPVFKINNEDAIWLTEGMAEYVARQYVSYPELAYPKDLFLRYTHYSKQDLITLIDEYEVFYEKDLLELNSWPNFWSPMDYRPYESLVYYLEKQYGKEAFLNWVTVATESQNLVNTTKDILGSTEKEIIQNWKRYFLIGEKINNPAEITIGSYFLRQDISEFKNLQPKTDLVLNIKDYLTEVDIKELLENNQIKFTLSAPGKPSLDAYVTGGFYYDHIKRLQVDIPDIHLMESGIPYTLTYDGEGETKIKLDEKVKIYR